MTTGRIARWSRILGLTLLVLAEAACGLARSVPDDQTVPARRDVSHLAYYHYLLSVRELREG